MSARDRLRLVLQDSFGSEYEESDTEGLYNEIAHELAEKIRDGAVGYNAGEYSKASQIGPGRVMEFTQSAIADWIDPEVP